VQQVFCIEIFLFFLEIVGRMAKGAPSCERVRTGQLDKLSDNQPMVQCTGMSTIDKPAYLVGWTQTPDVPMLCREGGYWEYLRQSLIERGLLPKPIPTETLDAMAAQAKLAHDLLMSASGVLIMDTRSDPREYHKGKRRSYRKPSNL